MIFKKSNASSDFIMAMGKKVGNIKEPRKGGTTDVSHDKKTGMKKKVSAQPPRKDMKSPGAKAPVAMTVSQRQKMGALGTVKC